MRRWAASIAAAGLAFACAPHDPLPEPPEVAYGFDECSACRMIVSEPRFAAVARDPAGEPYRFDDPGCLVDHLRRAGAQGTPGAGWHAWVHAEGAAGWIPAPEAGYVHHPGILTPMASGIVPEASLALARDRAARRGGTVFTYQELLANGRPLPRDAVAARDLGE